VVLLCGVVLAGLVRVGYRDWRLTGIFCPADTRKVEPRLREGGMMEIFCVKSGVGEEMKQGPYKAWTVTWGGHLGEPVEQGAYRDDKRTGTWVRYRHELGPSYRPSSSEVVYEDGIVRAIRYCDEVLPWYRSRCRADVTMTELSND
jgi:hypothetical protein